MAQYNGKVDDYLQATAGALEVATDTRYLPVYDPATNEVKWFRIDTSERGNKEIDKLLNKTADAVKNAQSDLSKLVDKIAANGGGTVLQRRPKITKTEPAATQTQSTDTSAAGGEASADSYSGTATPSESGQSGDREPSAAYN